MSAAKNRPADLQTPLMWIIKRIEELQRLHLKSKEQSLAWQIQIWRCAAGRHPTNDAQLHGYLTVLAGGEVSLPRGAHSTDPNPDQTAVEILGVVPPSSRFA